MFRLPSTAISATTAAAAIPLLLLLQLRPAASCGAGGIGGSNDYEIIADPVFDMDISPPVGWTYFPAAATGAAAMFFVGQSNDTTTAKMRADTELKAAMIEALVASQVTVTNVQVTNTYQPESFANPGTTTTGTGDTQYGKVEGGAMTQFYKGAGTIVFAPYAKATKVTLRNVQATRYTWTLVKNNFLQKMALNYNAKFTGDITVGKY